MHAQDDNRTKILKASLALFGAKGYSETTTKEIAEHSGLSEGTVFNHFKDKSSIFQQVVHKYADLPVDELETTDRKVRYKDLREDLYHLATGYIEAIFSHIHILRIVMRSKTSSEPLTSQRKLGVLLKLYDHMQNYLAKAADNGLVPDKDYDIEINLFVSHLARITLFASASERTSTLTGKLKKSLFKQAAANCRQAARELFDCVPPAERKVTGGGEGVLSASETPYPAS